MMTINQRHLTCIACADAQADACVRSGLPWRDHARQGDCPAGKHGNAPQVQTAPAIPIEPAPHSGPIRVAIALGDLAQGGVSRWIATLVESLDRRDDVRVSGVYVNGVFKWDADAARRIALRCPLVVRDAGDTPHAQRATPDSWAELVRDSAIVTSALHQEGNEAPPALRRPWVWQAHGECEWTRRAYSHVSDRTTRVMVVSEACRQALAFGHPTDLVEAAVNVERVTPIVDRLAARHALWAHERAQRWDYAVAEQPWVTFVGRFAHDKGIRQTCDVVAALREQFGPVLGLFVGGGHAERELRRHIRDTLGDAAIIAPWQDSLSDIMAAADVLTCFSAAEGAPLTVLEAVAAGVPVVGHPVGLLPELQSATPCVRVVDPGHVDAAAEAIAAYLTRPKPQRDADAWAGHAYVASRFHPSRMAEAFAQCMRAALGHG